MHADAARRRQAREDEHVGGREREREKVFVLKCIQGFRAGLFGSWTEQVCKGLLTGLKRMGCEPGQTVAVMSKLYRGTALYRSKRKSDSTAQS